MEREGGQSGVGEGLEGQGNPGEESRPVRTLPLEVLPEEWREKSDAEIKVLLSQMSAAVVSANDRNRELEERLRNLEIQAFKQKEPEPPPEPDKPLEELIIENTEQALDLYLRKKGLISRFEKVESDVGEAVFRAVGREIDDFKEHEAEVRDLLRRSGAPITEQNILGAYTMVVGQKTLAERARRQREAVSREPAREEPLTPRKVELTSLEWEIAQGLGFKTPEEYIKARSEEYYVEVPTDGK